jgi:hypothetical protein
MRPSAACQILECTGPLAEHHLKSPTDVHGSRGFYRGNSPVNQLCMYET